MDQLSENTWFEKVPKVELHLHLEGAIPLDALWELIRKYGGDTLIKDISELEKRFRYRDFPNFIETWVWKNQFLREYEDFEYISETVARDLRVQNIRYTEVFFSPSDFARHGLKTQPLAEAIREGISRVPGIEISLVVDLVRDRGIENGNRTLEEINEIKDLGIVGITIGGSEKDYPPEPFAKVYEKARNLGFHTSAHAGEASGPRSIWGAINSLKVERIGHGVRAVEDAKLVQYLADKKIPLEMCPISNLKTGVVSSIESYPIKKFIEEGLVVTVNTDDPKMFNSSLAAEYRLLAEHLGFSKDEIRDLIIRAINASWMDKDRKANMVKIFKEDKGW